MSPAPPSTDLAERVKAYCDALGLFPAGERVGVGFSGGPDSLAMLDILSTIIPGGVALAIHVDHGLQAASAEMAAAAEDTGSGLGVPVEVRRVAVSAAKVAERGVEAAARTARYGAFAAAMGEHDLDVVALGHTADDRAETLLFNLMRGTGLDGLATMRPRRGPYVRPLLEVRRSETSTWCAARGLVPFADPQNIDPAFARTRVRLELMPLVEELRPGAAGRIAAAAGRLEADADLLSKLADVLRGEAVDERAGSAAFDVARLKREPRPLAARVVRAALAPLLGAYPPAAAVDAVLDARAGSVPGTNLVARADADDGGRLVVRTSPGGSEPVGLPSSGSVEVFGRRLVVRSCPTDVTLSVRPLRPGDRASWETRTVADRLARLGVGLRDREEALAVLAAGRLVGVIADGLGWWGDPDAGVEVWPAEGEA